MLYQLSYVRPCVRRRILYLPLFHLAILWKSTFCHQATLFNNLGLSP